MASRQDRWWFLIWAVVISILITLPYLVTAISRPPETVFLGSLLNSDDTAQFLAAMRQGAEGGYLYHNQFTPEQTRPLLMYLLYILWGKVTGWIGLEAVFSYHLLRWCGTLFSLAVILELARLLLPERHFRQGLPAWKTAFLLALFSSGLSWLMAFLPRKIGMPHMADLALLEISTFQSFFVVPHFAWGIGLEMSTLMCFVRAVRAQSWRQRSFWAWAVGGGLVCLAMGLVYPFALVVVYAVLGATVVVALALRQAWRFTALLSAVAIGLLSIWVAIYYASIFMFDPLWHTTHVVGNVTKTPPVLTLVLGYGLVLALAVAGIVWVLKKRQWHDAGLGFLVIWAVTNGVLLYVPVPFQVRFAAGWHVALSMLAAVGLYWISQSLFTRRAGRLRNVVVILTIPSTLLVVLAGPYMAMAQKGFPFYLPTSELDAVNWLSAQVEAEDVVLASYAIGNVIPTRAVCRVFVGHQFESYRRDAKLAQLDAFFSTDTTESFRQAMLREYDITFVYYGHIEQKLGGFDPLRVDYLEQVYQAKGVTILRVRLG